MTGKDGWTHPNAEMRPDSEHMHGVLEGDGRWWWALNGHTNQPEGWPLGPVVGQTAPGAGMAGTDGRGQKQHNLARDGGGDVHAGGTFAGGAGGGGGGSEGWVRLPQGRALGAGL